jgi:hypothetical protein
MPVELLLGGLAAPGTWPAPPLLPPSLSLLTSLTALEMQDLPVQQFSPHLSVMTGLQRLRLDGMGAAGGLPPQWSALSALTVMALGRNPSLVGGVPWVWAGGMQGLTAAQVCGCVSVRRSGVRVYVYGGGVRVYVCVCVTVRVREHAIV